MENWVQTISTLIGGVGGAFIAFIGVMLTNREHTRRLKTERVARELADHRDRLRTRAEELHQILGQWGLVVSNSYLAPLAGADRNEGLDLVPEYYTRIRVLIHGYFPHLARPFDVVIEAGKNAENFVVRSMAPSFVRDDFEEEWRVAVSTVRESIEHLQSLVAADLQGLH